MLSGTVQFLLLCTNLSYDKAFIVLALRYNIVPGLFPNSFGCIDAIDNEVFDIDALRIYKVNDLAIHNTFAFRFARKPE